ncbi:putative glyoxalase superfamily protein PhnB [Leifsonia sp. EB41]|uniref:glyoxalase n=1 Tax=Leifsonia sp. EB41 TaxID=3156260 RepID=UPI003515B936
MTSIDHITLEVADASAAQQFYDAAFGLGDRVRVRASDTPSTGFRGYTMSITVAQPADVTAYVEAALAAGATTIKPVAKSFWGVGGTVQAPDGAIWKIATSEKKDSGPAKREPESVVLLLGVDDVGASKQFYAARGLPVGKSFGSYVQFDLKDSPVQLGLYKRRALAKDAGVAEDGSGSHRIVIGGESAATDPDGFAWETAAD